MKLRTTYSVAVYAADNCQFYKNNNTVCDTELLSNDDDTLPNSTQLEKLQKPLLHTEAIDCHRVLILVPDNWLSISTHQVERHTPNELLPLAAMSFAAESTFSPPESLLFHYDQRRIEKQSITLEVTACSIEWARLLAKPFDNRGIPYLVMSFTQWSRLKTGTKSWSYLTQQSLSIFQPDRHKRIKQKRLWIGLIVSSVVLHCAAYFYQSSLYVQSQQLAFERHASLDKYAIWRNQQQSSEFVATALNFAQSLPKKTRLTAFEGTERGVSLQVMLLKEERAELLARWRQQYPSWRWIVNDIKPIAPSLTINEEVINVSLSIFQN